MESAIMAIRVALLILVTGAFAALWSGDHPEQLAAAGPRVKKADDIRPMTPQHTREHLSRVPAERADRSRGTVCVSLSTVPLPAGIPAGTYLVADRTGKTQIRVVGLNDTMAGIRGDTTTDHYSIELNGARWHFIRINPKPEDRTASQPVSTSIR
jgi:hypothetical protein